MSKAKTAKRTPASGRIGSRFDALMKETQDYEAVKRMSKKRFDSVWDAIEDPAEAENMKLRAKLMRALVNHIEKKRLTQAAAAKLMSVTQPRVSDLVRGKVDLFSMDTLINMASAAGLQVDLKIARAA